MAASSRERSVTWAPGRACRTTPVSAAVSSRGPTIAITFGWGARFPRAQRGTTANWLPAGTPARLARPPTMCSRSRRPATDSALPWLTTALPDGDTSTGTAPAGAASPPGRASEAAGNRAAGVPAVSAAYRRWSTIATGSETPWSDVPVGTDHEQRDRDRREHGRQAGEQVHAAGRWQALVAEDDQAGDGSADQRAVGDPPPRCAHPAPGGRPERGRRGGAAGPVLPHREQRRAGQRGPDDTGCQPHRQPRGGSGGEQDRRTGRQQSG